MGANAVPKEQAPPQLAPQVEASTTLKSAVAIGVTVLPVESTSDFLVGREIVIDANTAVQEVNEIVSIGSLVLKSPLRFSHSAGAPVTMPKANAVPAQGGDAD